MLPRPVRDCDEELPVLPVSTRTAGRPDIGVPRLLSAHVLPGPEVLEGLGDTLDRLERRCRAPVVQRRTWLQAWLEVAPPTSVQTVVVTSAERLEAALVLHESALPDGPRLVQPLCPRGDERLVVSRTTEVAERLLAVELAGALRARRDRWVLRLGPLVDSGAFCDQIARSLPGSLVREGAPIPLVTPPVARRCSAGGCPCLSSNMQRKLRKARNRLAADGAVLTERVVRNARDLTEELPWLWQVRCARDARAGRLDPDPDGHLQCFWRESLLRHARAGLVELSLLEVDGRLAAYVLALDEPAVYGCWRAAATATSPGTAPGGCWRPASSAGRCAGRGASWTG